MSTMTSATGRWKRAAIMAAGPPPRRAGEAASRGRGAVGAGPLETRPDPARALSAAPVADDCVERRGRVDEHRRPAAVDAEGVRRCATIDAAGHSLQLDGRLGFVVGDV